MTKSEIEPQSKQLVMDLLSLAGVDVRDWGTNFKKGRKNAASNPKYCYEWSFDGPRTSVVVNLWFDSIKEKNGRLELIANMREWASEPHLTGPQKRRSIEMDERLRRAFQKRSVVRAIICSRKNLKSPVSKRYLDPENWAVTAYEKSGLCTLVRGAHVKKKSKLKEESAIDDLFDQPKGNPFPNRAKTVSTFIQRDNNVRRYVLKRSKGKCEYCRRRGFLSRNGKFYVETHHIIALCNEGRDTVDNVIALCPQHHREAHYGKNGQSLEIIFTGILKRLNKG